MKRAKIVLQELWERMKIWRSFFQQSVFKQREIEVREKNDFKFSSPDAKNDYQQLLNQAEEKNKEIRRREVKRNFKHHDHSDKFQVIRAGLLNERTELFKKMDNIIRRSKGENLERVDRTVLELIRQIRIEYSDAKNNDKNVDDIRTMIMNVAGNNKKPTVVHTLNTLETVALEHPDRFV